MGVWICQTKAVVVRLDENGATCVTMTSDIAPRHRSTGGTRAGRAFLHRSVNSTSREEAAREAAIERFFDEVAHAVEGADELVVLGPGGARTAFAARLPRGSMTVRAVEPAGSRSSEAQIVARVMAMFGRAAPRKARQVPGLAVNA
jgi:hypothetical protein